MRRRRMVMVRGVVLISACMEGVKGEKKNTKLHHGSVCIGRRIDVISERIRPPLRNLF